VLSRQKFADKILQLIIFFLPTQLGYHFWPQWAHIFGIRVDYFAPTIYLTDLLVGIYILLKIPNLIKKGNLYKVWIIFPLILLVIFNIIFSVNQPVSIYLWLKIVEMVMFGVVVATTNRGQIKKIIYKPLKCSLIIFSIIGILQTISGQTLNGLFYFLGERTFNLGTPGIALGSLLGNSFLRAYSTFSHPNALAGFLLVGNILLFWAKDGKPLNNTDKLTVIFSFIAMVFAFSLSAALCLIFVLTFYITFQKNYLNKIKIGLFALVLISLVSTMAGSFFLDTKAGLTENVGRRLELSLAAGKIISKNPIFGVGLGGFINLLPQTGLNSRTSWWLQPVHNIFLLIFSETGLVGLLGAVYFLIKSIGRKPKEPLLLLAIIAVLITGSLDHYWLTLQQNQLLLSVLLALFFI
jgi:O-antigen ligase